MSGTATLKLADETAPQSQDPSIGKDLLELLSSAMYEDPLTLYREYVQNAVDSIDQARASGTLAPNEGAIDILIDTAGRNVRITDNGAGIPAEEFASRMRSIGSSVKRGTQARGFRGVGRLSGLAYAQRVIFRSRSSASEPVQQISWDCRKLRAGLKDSGQSDLAEFICEISDLEVLTGDWPERFFEVELSGVIRYGDDRLVRPEAVADYLAQVAPVPFSPEFELGRDIETWIESAGKTNLRVAINGGEPIFRPHRDVLELDGKVPVHLRELETFEIPAVDGGVAARGWIAHHDYQGAIPAMNLKGLRVRAGDIQIGNQALLEDIFPEPRFGAWAIGEVHIQDRRIVPNGRRDGFEQNTHFANLRNHLAPFARGIAKRCRTNSSARQRRRTFELQAAQAEQKLELLEQGILNASARANLAAAIETHIVQMGKIIESTAFADQESLRARFLTCQTRLASFSGGTDQDPLARISGARGEGIREIISLIYECSNDVKSAKSLVERILDRLQ